MHLMEQHVQTSRLLQLPAELRVAIWEHVFADDRAPVAIGLPSTLPWQGKPARYHPALSEVCTIVRKETMPIFYLDRSVILLLRFREGRAQVQHWIKHVYSSPKIYTRLRNVRIQYFEDCHRSTAFDLDMESLLLLNGDSWLHPLTDRPLRLLEAVENVMSEERDSSHVDKPRTLQRIIATMTAPLRFSRLMRQESMANLRLHGYTDFDLRFESSTDPEEDLLNFVIHRQSRRMAHSRLMLLPTELRLDIIEYALQEELALGVGGSYTLSPLAPKVFGGDATKHATQPSITCVSRQLRQETLGLFYRLNTFLLAVHYRRARAEVDKWIDFISSNPNISANLRTVTIKHRFGILDFRGTIDLDLRQFRILGPRLWYNAIPPLTRKEVERIVDEAREAERSHEVTVRTLRRLIEVLGIEPPTQTAISAP